MIKIRNMRQVSLALLLLNTIGVISSQFLVAGKMYQLLNQYLSRYLPASATLAISFADLIPCHAPPWAHDTIFTYPNIYSTTVFTGRTHT